MTKKRQLVDELTGDQRKAVAEILGESGPATIVLVYPIHFLSMGTRVPVRELAVHTFKRGPQSLTFDYEGAKREVFFSNIVEIIYG